MQPSLFDEPSLQTDVALKIEAIAEADLPAALSEGGLLLTASAGLALAWKRACVVASDQSVCITPAVISWQDWINALATQDSNLSVPLNRMQETRLWEQVIRDDGSSSASHSSSSLRGLARHARDAFALMKDYRIETRELAFGGEEAEALAGWISAMAEQLGRGALAGRTLSAMQAEHLLADITRRVSQTALILDGFDRFTPMQEAILTALQGAGKTVLSIQHEQIATPVLTACSDQTEEFQLLAKRIRSSLDEEPQIRIGVALSDAIKDTKPLCRALNVALMPAAGSEAELQAVNMPAASLSDLPMISQLLHMLAMAAQSTVSFNDFSRLLFSPWLKGYADERMARSEFDRQLRRLNRHQLSLQTIVDSPMMAALPELKPLFATLSSWDEKACSVLEWVSRVHGLLQQSGFVQISSDGEPRSSSDIRQMNAFRDTLSSLVSIDAVAGRLNWSSFLSLLRSACSETQFGQPGRYANITVLPISQMAGMSFDKLYVIGLDEEVFPMPVRSQPLLPPVLQQKFNIANSRAELAFEHSTWLWQQLLNTAPIVELSYAALRNEQEMHVSPFARNLPPQRADVSPEKIQQLEQDVYADAPDLPLLADESVRGGTALIRDQSACPFRSFATWRLGISELDETEPGIEATTKGSLIHLALEYIWQQLRSRSALSALDAEGRSLLIAASIRHAWQQQGVSLTSAIKAIEVKRMATVLEEWLETELLRPGFRVKATEADFTLQLPQSGSQQVTIRVKADRIDEDEEGRTILIDYKTGAPQSFRKWLGERIEEPQLPLYAVAAGLSELDVVTYGRVRTGQMGFEGLSGEGSGIKGVTACDGKRGAPDDWDAVLQLWREQVNALAAEFVAGRSEVAPRDEKACNYCGLESICRIEERGFVSDSGEES